MEYLHLEVKKIIKETEDAVSIHFKQPEDKKIEYKSGQFFTFIFDINGKEERRAYSLCSSPYVDADLAVAVKRVNKGLISNHINSNIKEGDTIKALAPTGAFTFVPDETKERHIILLGGGSGITPLFSILKTTLEKEQKSKITLVYANQSKKSTIFAQQIEDIQSKNKDRVNVLHYLDEENVGKKKLLGLKKQKPFLTKAKLKEMLAPLNLKTNDPVEFYICGPSGMMKVAEDTLLSLSFPSSIIKKESFVSLETPKSKSKTKNKVEEGEPKKVKVKYLGQEYDFDVKPGVPILQTALDSGVDLPFSCQSGLCTACMGKLIQGKIDMRMNLALTDQEVDQGLILTCVGHPMSDDVVIEIE